MKLLKTTSESTSIMPVRDYITDEIRSDIISGDLAPNEKLNEQALASRFGVSRGPIRDAILQLTKEGLLISKPNCGASVNSVLTPDLQLLMIDLRRKIEAHAIKNLIGKMEKNDFTALEKILQRIRESFKAKDFTEVTKADIDFHRFLIYKAGGDELVNIWHPIVMRMRLSYNRIRKARECVNEHKTIIDALRKSDLKQAVQAIKKNIR